MLKINIIGERAWCAAKSKHVPVSLLEDDSAVFFQAPSAEFANVRNLKCLETETWVKRF